MWVFLFFQIVFCVIFYNYKGYSCLHRLGNNIKLMLYVKLKMIELDVFSKPKLLRSSLFSRPNYLGFGVVVKPKMFGSAVILLKKKIILF